jgi:hypothetical protein
VGIMGARDIIELLEKNKGKFFSAEQISNKLNLSRSVVCRCLTKNVSKRQGIYSTTVMTEKMNHKRKHRFKIFVYTYIGDDE